MPTSEQPAMMQSEFIETILDSIADGVFTVDHEWRVTSFNHAAERITGISKQDALGKPCCEVFRANICESECALRWTMESDKSVVNKTVYIITGDGRKVPISISTAILKDNHGQVIGGVETFRDLTLVEELRKELAGKFAFADIISKSREMQQIFEILPDIAVSGSTVLIEGESGTGKGLFAQAIHNLSPRKEKPFIAVNCGALPDNLLESELFGYKAGAFTDAKKDKPGRFALAEGGTIFLDEIGDVSPALQTRLLRVLEEKTYEPLGGIESIKADIRVIAATNKSLDDLVKDGIFRRDLFYRINVMRIEIPPLRRRTEDVPLLIDYFIDRFNHLRNKEICGFSEEALACIMRHDYPGNVRELENIIEHAFILCHSAFIEKQHLPDDLLPSPEKASIMNYSATLEEAEKWFILEALKRNDWNRQMTAKDLGIHKTTLFRKIKSLGIELPDKDGRSSQP
ncbi:sigma-54 interaction domain-containing protein [Planctomycetota bacterium]